MAKVYGNRWRLLDKPPLGQGGQATVFRVTDDKGQYEGELALKRVKNVRRHDRFVREIEAVRRLIDPNTNSTHPNVIPVIDHSALDESENPAKQFLVMPIAKGGDLSEPGRLSLYKDSMDGVLSVAKQIAAALSVAHTANVFHRDVKPENILFTGSGNDLWLSDFGICLIRELPRLTESPEVMGPWGFMAPELARGGELAVTPSADIYSLGKVIFYMMSGGIVLPREEIYDSKFQVIFDRGQRYRLMEMLLGRMVREKPDERFQSMADILARLDQIELWEQKARLTLLDENTFAILDQKKRQSLEAGRITAANKDARNQEVLTLSKTQVSVTSWLKETLDENSSFIASDTFKCLVQDAAVNELRIATGSNSMYLALNAVELTLQDVNDVNGRKHALQFFFCRHNKKIVTVASQVLGGSSRNQSALPKPQPAEDIQFAIVAVYRQMFSHRPGNNPSEHGYLTRQEKIGAVRERALAAQRSGRGRPDMVRETVGPVSPSFGKGETLHIEFQASQWPANTESIRAFVKASLDAFIKLI